MTAVAIFCDSAAVVLNGYTTAITVASPMIQLKNTSGRGVAVFLCVGPVAEAVLKIDTEILDRFAMEFVEYALVKSKRKPGLGTFLARGARVLFYGVGKRG